MDEMSPELLRAARLSGLPGVTIDTACKRFDVTEAELQQARAALGPAWLRPTREDLVLAMLTDYATESEGPAPTGLEAMASYVDFVEKDGCTAVEVRALIDGLVTHGLLTVTRTRWKLLAPWPFHPPRR